MSDQESWSLPEYKLFDLADGVISYLIGCMEHPETTGKIYEIDGHDKMTCGELTQVCTASLKNLFVIQSI